MENNGGQGDAPCPKEERGPAKFFDLILFFLLFLCVCILYILNFLFFLLFSFYLFIYFFANLPWDGRNGQENQ